MGAVQGRELDWITDEEYREVIADYIPVSFIGEEFQCPSSNVANSIGRAFGSSDRRETS
jgi:hypothetical protein